MVRAWAIVAAAFVLVPPLVSARSGQLELIKLADRHPAAVCNDGTSSGYYFRKASSAQGSKTWIVYLESGGWCWDSESCNERCTNNRTRCSSEAWESTLELDGIMSATNDDLHDSLRTANKVFVRYCTSDAHMGDSSAFGYQFRGHQVVQAVLSDLIRLHGLGSAGGEKHFLLFGGGSAGARGAMVHLDYVPSMLGNVEAAVDVVGFLDSPLWLDTEALNTTAFEGFLRQTAKVHSFANVTHLGARCAATYAAEPWKCMFGEYRMPLLDSRYMVVASLQDAFQLVNLEDNRMDTQEGLEYMDRFENKSIAMLKGLAGPGRLVFGPACFSHAESLTDDGFFGHTAGDGRTQSLALQSFLGLSGEANDSIVFIDGCQGFDCGGGCHREPDIYEVSAAFKRSFAQVLGATTLASALFGA